MFQRLSFMVVCAGITAFSPVTAATTAHYELEDLDYPPVMPPPSSASATVASPHSSPPAVEPAFERASVIMARDPRLPRRANPSDLASPLYPCSLSGSVGRSAVSTSHIGSQRFSRREPGLRRPKVSCFSPLPSYFSLKRMFEIFLRYKVCPGHMPANLEAPIQDLMSSYPNVTREGALSLILEAFHAPNVDFWTAFNSECPEEGSRRG